MASGCTPRLGLLRRRISRACTALTLLGLGLAWPQPQPGLPNLPGVQDELAGAGQHQAAPARPAPAAPAKPRFASLDEARDTLRGAFARMDYSAVMGLAAEIRQQFPDQTFTRYYESMAQLRISDNSDNSKLPYRRLEAVTAANLRSTQTAAASARSTQTVAATAPTATPRMTTAPAATPTPAAPIATPPPPAVRARPSLAQLGGAFKQQGKYLLFGLLGLAGVGGICLLLIAMRRRKAAGGDEEEALDSILASTIEPPQATQSNWSFRESPPILEDEDLAPEPPPSPASSPMRSEVSLMATHTPILTPPPLELEREDEPAPPEPEPEAPPPHHEPVFALAEAEEDVPFALTEAVEEVPTEIASAPATQDLPLAPSKKEGEEDLLMLDDAISFEDELFEPDLAPPSAPSPAEAAPPAEAKLSPQTPLPHFAPDKIAESLEIEGFPHATPPVSPPAAPLPPLTVPPQRASAEEPENEPLGPEEETLTGLPESALEEALTHEGGPRDTTLETPAHGVSESQDFQAFHPGETVTFHLGEKDASEEETAYERTQISEEPPREEKMENALEDRSTDVFEREYRQGIKDTEERNWVGAIHHLSIAAALRPGVLDVKERLREARRMRAKELEGRG